MIDQLCLDAADQLRKLEFPIECHYSPERLKRERYNDAILFSRDREIGDQIQPAHASHGRYTTDQRASWMIGGMIEVYAQSTLPGARTSDHEAMGDLYVEAVVCAVSDWCAKNKMGQPEYTEARYVPASERSEEEQWPGVLYRMRMRIGRGIYRRRFDRPLPDVAEILDVHTTLTEPENED